MPTAAPNPFLPTRDCICSAYRRATRALTQHFESHFRGSGLRGTQFTVLATLAQTGPIPSTRLAKLLGMERTTLTRNLKPLEDRKLITISAGQASLEQDARIRQVAITKQGTTLALKLLPQWQQAQQSAHKVLAALQPNPPNPVRTENQ
jgi:DNA-binding MarR family transcriptional regulator